MNRDLRTRILAIISACYPYGPSIKVFGNRMILLWPDLAAGEKQPDFEPLYCTFCAGVRQWLRRIACEGESDVASETCPVPREDNAASVLEDFPATRRRGPGRGGPAGR